MEHTIGNLGQEIWQPLKPFANIVQEGEVLPGQRAPLHAT